MPKNVGSSDRTIGKHPMTRAIAFMAMGSVLHLPRFNKYPYYQVDTCAGDGLPNFGSGTSSPQILMATAAWGREMGLDVRNIFIEKDPTTFAELQEAVRAQPGYDPRFDQVILGDARRPGVLPTMHPSSGAFVNNDSNTMHGFTLTKETFTALPRSPITVSTLGCNVNGICGRLNLEVRDPGWYGHIQGVLNALPPNHDAYLFALGSDAAKFAWLLTGPIVWRKRIAREAAKAFSYWKGTPRAAWWKQDPEQFQGIADYLFMTAKERASA